MRPHQDEFITTVYNAVHERRSVLIEGSNGLGKTISALSACIPVAMEKNLKILYVARTHRQHDRVIEELRPSTASNQLLGFLFADEMKCALTFLQPEALLTQNRLMEVCELLKAKSRCPYYTNVDERTYEYIQLQQQLQFAPTWHPKSYQYARKKKFVHMNL